MEQNPTCSRADRKTVERNRRSEMKALYSNLNSLLPRRPREMASLPDQLEGATNYIKMMQAHLEKMNHKKSFLMSATANHLPNIDVRAVTASAMEVILITAPNSHYLLFSGIIRLLHEEGVEVVAAGFSVLHNTVFHTIHSKIGDQCAQNNGAARLSDRLRKFVYDSI